MDVLQVLEMLCEANPKSIAKSIEYQYRYCEEMEGYTHTLKENELKIK